MADQEAELAIMKTRLDQHDKIHEETQGAIKSMAEGIQKLAQAEVRREQDQETFGRIFEEIKSLRTDFEAYKETQSAKELADAKAELASQSKHIWDVRSIILTAVAMLILWIIAEKLGIHIPA